MSNNQLQHPEPLLADSRGKYQLFPIKYPVLWKLCQDAEASYWRTEELDFSKDKNDWASLNEDEKRCMKYVLGYFAVGDGMVIDDVISLNKVIAAREFHQFNAFKEAIEAVHFRVYSTIISEYYDNTLEMEEVLKFATEEPCIKRKIEFGERLTETCGADRLGMRIIAYVIVEGLFFQGSFALIGAFKERRMLPGLCEANRFISRDEAQHARFGCEAFKYIVNKPSTEEVHALMNEAVEIESQFFNEALRKDLYLVSRENMLIYIRYVADLLLRMLGYPLLYRVNNPFEFMEKFNALNMQNFFEGRVTGYARGEEKRMEKLDLTDDF
ncbi:Ribonucleotide reductase of class Ia (aerobic), beta subunit [Kaumoebavirus]|uniref:Ribonucleotide reductase of class Ia (aerobic), beta subunit n=1 Tax=Kaumoebavirus TaxID=1859492 RepID=UPI0009C2F1AC|nr:Ribonucleotide reductase of class Ia (aerobic), beta subunit [Kaumoebavirus]ARA71899.1 Ribonucleotide reductase of class Ia (aerobic), beta subunit [Kaumoebavirus]